MLIRQFKQEDPNDSTRLGEFDNLFKVPIGIEVAHHEIHEGDGFTLCLATADLSAADIGFSWTTPAGTKRMHMWISASSTEDAVFTFYEGGTPAGGGAATPLNRNRGSGTTSSATLFKSGAVSTGGGPATLCQKRWGTNGIGNQSGTGAGDRAVNEWVLNPSTSYHLIMSGAGNEPAWLELDWYEHTDE